MALFQNLSKKENEAILKFPAYITLLAANADGILDEDEKNAAIKLSHMKTFSCDALLEDFYREADQVFEQNIEMLDRDLPKEINRREAALKKGLYAIERIALKLGTEYCSVMNLSMKSFKDHVSKAHHNIFVDFIFPLPLPDIII
jgi:hypothetical protein